MPRGKGLGIHRNDVANIKTLIFKTIRVKTDRDTNTPLRKKKKTANHTVTHTHVTYTHPLIQTKSQHPCARHPPTHHNPFVTSHVESP